MEAEKKPPAVSDMGAWAMNVVSSVGIIMANKQLMSSSGYAFAFGNPPLSSPPPRERASGSGMESGSAGARGIRGSAWGASRLIVLFFPLPACECAQPPR